LEKINVQVKMFMKFRKYLPAGASDGKATISLMQGSTLEDLRSTLGIPVEVQGGAVINGLSYGVDDSQVLKEGDVISFFTPVAGG